MKKTIFIILIVLIIGSVLGVLVYKYFNNPSAITIIPAKEKKVIKDLAHYDEPFQWGATVRAYALGDYVPQVWDEEIDVMKELGIKWARISWDYENVDVFKRNNEVLNKLWDQGIEPVLVIERNPKIPEGDEYQLGYDDGFKIASHYKGKVKYYQMMNEASSGALNSPTSGGQKKSDFTEENYLRVTKYLRGLSEGLQAGDSNAWRIISIPYTHVGFVDKVMEDKIGFDIIGISWYDWAGDISKKKLDDGTLYTTKLKSYNMPIMFMEVNAVPENNGDGTQQKTVVNEEKQSSFISQTAEWAYRNKDFVKGFYVHELIDNVNNTNDNFERFGIYSATKEPGKMGVLGAPRKAFETYKALIKKYSSWF